MTTPRKDVKFTLPEEQHQAMRLIAEQQGLTLCEWVERLVSRKLMRLAHDAILLADAFRRTGIEKTFRESAFTGGKDDHES